MKQRRKAMGQCIILVLLALSATIAHGFTSSVAVAVASSTVPLPLPLFSKQIMELGVGSAATEADSCPSIDDSSDMKMMEGYEYIHPEIAAMLLTKASNGLPFAVDQSTLILTLQKASQTQDDLSSDVMPIEKLAGLAEECDRAAFSENNDHDIPKKILGLIRLSQFPTSAIAEKNAEEKNEWENPAILVATMVALNLLESSIRAVVMGSSRDKKRNKDENKTKQNGKRKSDDSDSNSQRGAPLLRDMIQEMSNMDHFTLHSTTSSTDIPQGEISASDIAPILRALLLPTRVGGINLRNLISHGFLSTIDRRWFSLTLVLIQTLDRLLVSNTDLNEGVKVDDVADRPNKEAAVELNAKVNNQSGTSSLTKYGSMAKEVDIGKSILLQSEFHSKIQAGGFIPSSHMPLLQFSLHLLAPTLHQSLHMTMQSSDYMPKSTALEQSKDDTTMHVTSIPSTSIPSLTAVFTTVMCSLLEHSLRLLWCRANNRPDDRMARPSTYYVTLDGHGQRDKHEVAITPYLRDGKTRNQLIPVIGAEACALLSDLFAAPSVGAPNIRSAVCHGSWDGELVNELEGLATTVDKKSLGKSNPLLMDSAFALISCLDLISSNISGKSSLPSHRSPYRPVYTYTSTAVRNLERIFRDLVELDSLISNNPSVANCMKKLEQQQPKLCNDMKPFKIELEVVKGMAYELLPTMKKASDEPWGIGDTYSEHQTNTVLAENVAALTLLSDASYVVKKYLAGVRERIDKLTMEANSTKDRRMVKTAARFCSAAMLAHEFYTFTVYVALLAIQQDSQNKSQNSKNSNDDDGPPNNREDIVRAVERSRMSISTFDSHLTTNIDRSLKALQTYLQGKVVKKVITQKNR